MAETLRSPTPQATDLRTELLRMGLKPIAGGKAEVEEEFEIELPEDEEPVVPEGAAEPDTEEPEPEPAPEAKKPEPPKKEVKSEPEPEPVKAEEPEPEPELKPKRLDPIAREERNKRKEYARLYAETKSQLDAAERTIRLLREQPTDPNDPNLAKWHKELADEASKATDLADVLKLTLKEMDRRDRVSRRELNVHLYQIQCDISETRARAAHPDFESICAQAGVFDAIQTDAHGQFRDPAIANRVYYTADKKLAPDPAERMYRLAVGKLEYEKSLKGEDEEPEEIEPREANHLARLGRARRQREAVRLHKRRPAQRLARTDRLDRDVLDDVAQRHGKTEVHLPLDDDAEVVGVVAQEKDVFARAQRPPPADRRHAPDLGRGESLEELGVPEEFVHAAHLAVDAG